MLSVSEMERDAVVHYDLMKASEFIAFAAQWGLTVGTGNTNGMTVGEDADSRPI